MRNKERLREEWIVIRCQLRECNAYSELINIMERRLLYYIRRFVNDEHTALDILQEIWLVVFQKIKKLKEASAIRAWLYKIAHDKLANYLRHKTIEEKVLDELPIKDVDTQIVFSKDEAQQIHQVMDKLNP
ncbi:MAG: sigma-70 family RNA polymerase sigma factor, partial [Planctomycetota bacterium]